MSERRITSEGSRIGSKANSYRPWFEGWSGIKQWNLERFPFPYVSSVAVTIDALEFYKHIIRTGEVGSPISAHLPERDPHEYIVVIEDRYFSFSGF